jgi:hypothetical protein
MVGVLVSVGVERGMAEKLLTWRLTTITHSPCRLNDGNGLVIRMYVLIGTY